MKTLTHRTDVNGQERRQEKRRTDSHRQARQGRMTRGQRGIISRRSSWAGYCYAKSSVVRWNRASQVVEGMRWNAYMAHGKATPLSSYHRDALPPIASGIMDSMRMNHEKRIKKGHSVAGTKMETHMDAGIAASLKIADKKKAQTITGISRILESGSPSQILKSGSTSGERQAKTADISQNSMAIEQIAVQRKELNSKEPDSQELDSETKCLDSGNRASPPSQEPQPTITQPVSGSPPASESLSKASSIIQIPVPGNDAPAGIISGQSPSQNQRCEDALPTPAVLRPGTQRMVSGSDQISSGKSPDYRVEGGPAAVSNILPYAVSNPILPYSEGLMEMAVERPSITSGPNPVPVKMTRDPGYISTMRKKIRSLKTASAAADMPL